jgi:ribosomal protein S14
VSIIIALFTQQSITWVALLILAFVAFGWQASIIALLLSFVYGAVFRPVSVRLAAKLQSIGGDHPAGRHVGLPPGPLAAISRELGREFNPEQAMQELFSGRGRREKAEEALLDYCEADGRIRDVMAQFNVSRDTLRGVYSRLLVAGAGQWAGGHYVAASAIAYPHTLRYVLSRPAEGREALLEIAYRLIMHFERGAPLE